MKKKGLSASDWLRLSGLVLYGIVKVLGWASGTTRSKTQRRPPRAASPGRAPAAQSREWDAAATDRCQSARERRKYEEEAARRHEVDELRAKAGQKPPVEEAIDRDSYVVE